MPLALIQARRLRLAIAASLAVAACGCAPGGSERAADVGPPPAGVNGGEAGYLAPPSLAAVRAGWNGTVILDGRAPAGAAVRLAAPEGDSLTAKAGANGAWSLRTGPLTRPRMYAMSAAVAGREVHSEGAVILIPGAVPTALLARAGYGALAAVGRVHASPSLLAVDYDGGGFAVISGTAAPRATVRLLLDGAPSGLGQADAQGRYGVLAANRRLGFGPHLAAVETGDATVQRHFLLTAPAPLATPYVATAEPDGWRVEWAPPGGGVQTTLVFSPDLSAAPVRPAGSR